MEMSVQRVEGTNYRIDLTIFGGQLAHRLGEDAVQPNHENAEGHDRHEWSQQKP